VITNRSEFRSKLNRYLKKDAPQPLADVKNEQDQHRIRQTLRAIEGFVMCQRIAIGLLQLIALRFSGRWFIYANLFFAGLLSIHVYR